MLEYKMPSTNPGPRPDGPTAQFNSEWFCSVAGWAQVWSFDNNSIYTGTNWVHFNVGDGGYPTYSEFATPLPTEVLPANKAYQFKYDNGSYGTGVWSVVDDYIGQTIWNEADASDSQVVKNIGPIPEGWTLLQPGNPNDTWNPKTNSWNPYKTPAYREAQQNFYNMADWITKARSQNLEIDESVYEYQRECANIGWPNGMDKPQLDVSQGLPNPPAWDDSKPYGGWAKPAPGMSAIVTGYPGRPRIKTSSPATETSDHASETVAGATPAEAQAETSKAEETVQEANEPKIADAAECSSEATESHNEATSAPANDAGSSDVSTDA